MNLIWGCVLLVWIPFSAAECLGAGSHSGGPNVTDAIDHTKYYAKVIELLENKTKIHFNGSEIQPFLTNMHLAPVINHTELYRSENRSCIHIMFDLVGSNLTYETGDFLGVYVWNLSYFATKLDRIRNYSLDDYIQVHDFRKRYKFPFPTTYREAFTYYLDLTEQPTKEDLIDLAFYTSRNRTQHRKMLEMTHTGKGEKLYDDWIVKGNRNFLDVLEAYDDCHPPLDVLVKIVPVIEPRYYSVSSSALCYPKRVTITVVHVAYYNESTGLVNYGLASTFLKLQCNITKDNPHPIVPICFRKSSFRLPQNHSVPILMIGPGTGIAPFRAFIQERDMRDHLGYHVGETILYFGCRRRDEDYLYGQELEVYAKKGTLKLHVAFSRETSKKVYVTDLLEQNVDEVWKIMKEDGGNLYVCGDRKTLGKDVHNTLLRIIQKKGGPNTTSIEGAEKYLKKLEKEKRYFTDIWD